MADVNWAHLLSLIPQETKDALQDCVSHKIPKLLEEGYEQKQAEAIAYSMCGEKGKSLCPTTLPVLLARRGERPNALKRLGDTGRYGLMTKDARVDPAQVDTRRLCVPGTITTQDPDRSNDIVIASGVDCSEHEPNPVVLFEHGYAPDFGPRAIALARNPDTGAYTLTRLADRIRTESYFSQGIEGSEQIFELYVKGLCRGLSIGIIPLEMEYRRDQDLSQGGMPGLTIARCKLFEYSFCSVPDNPYALADLVLGKGLLCGRPILPSILKSLTPHLPQRIEQVTSGFTPPPTETPDMTTAAATPPATPDPKTKKLAPGKNGKPQLFVKAADSDDYEPLEQDDSTSTTMTKEESPEHEKEEDALSELPDRPVGAMFSEGIHDRLMDLMDYIDSGSSKHENADLASMVNDLSETVGSHADGLSEFYSATYPDQDPLTKAEAIDDDGDDDGDTEGGEEEVEKRKRMSEQHKRLKDRLKRFRAAQASRTEGVQKRLSKGARNVLVKAAGFLGEVGEHDGELRDSHKSAAMFHKSKLEDLAGGSGEADPYSDEEFEKSAALKAENAKLRKALEKTTNQHERLVKEFRKLTRGR